MNIPTGFDWTEYIHGNAYLVLASGDTWNWEAVHGRWPDKENWWEADGEIFGVDEPQQVALSHFQMEHGEIVAVVQGLSLRSPDRAFHGTLPDDPALQLWVVQNLPITATSSELQHAWDTSNSAVAMLKLFCRYNPGVAVFPLYEKRFRGPVRVTPSKLRVRLRPDFSDPAGAVQRDAQRTAEICAHLNAQYAAEQEQKRLQRNERRKLRRKQLRENVKNGVQG